MPNETVSPVLTPTRTTVKSVCAPLPEMSPRLFRQQRWERGKLGPPLLEARGHDYCRFVGLPHTGHFDALSRTITSSFTLGDLHRALRHEYGRWKGFDLYENRVRFVWNDLHASIQFNIKGPSSSL
jgi:hypothetical protein